MEERVAILVKAQVSFPLATRLVVLKCRLKFSWTCFNERPNLDDALCILNTLCLWCVGDRPTYDPFQSTLMCVDAPDQQTSELLLLNIFADNVRSSDIK